jgi:hypothetical protein
MSAALSGGRLREESTPGRLTVALCARLGLAAPAPDASGACVLSLPDGCALAIGGGREGISLSGHVRDLPETEEEKDALCRKLLALSLARTGRECGAFLPRLGVEGKAVLLRARCAPDLDADGFEAAVERFANLLETWRRLAAEQERRPSRPAGAVPSGPGRTEIIFP